MICSTCDTCWSVSLIFSFMSASTCRLYSSGSPFLPAGGGTVVTPVTVFTVYSRWPTAPTRAPLANTNANDTKAENLNFGIGFRLPPGIWSIRAYRRNDIRIVEGVGIRQYVDVTLCEVSRVGGGNRGIYT